MLSVISEINTFYLLLQTMGTRGNTVDQKMLQLFSVDKFHSAAILAIIRQTGDSSLLEKHIKIRLCMIVTIYQKNFKTT